MNADTRWNIDSSGVMAALLDPGWPPMWHHRTYPIPFPQYLIGRVRCKRCNQRFWGTHWTAHRITRYREHWLRDHCGLVRVVA